MSAVNNATAPTTAATVGPVNYALSAASYIGQYVPPSAGNGAFPKPPVAPPISNAVSYEVASKATQRLIAASLRDAGFSAAHPDAARWIEVEMVACESYCTCHDASTKAERDIVLEKLYQGATEYANLAARTRPTAVDMTAACTETGMPVEALRPIAAKASRKRKRGLSNCILHMRYCLISMHVGTRGVPGPLSLTTSVSRSPSPELLPSDDEGSLPVVPATLRGLPVPVPKLPPKHTYLRTPVSVSPSRSRKNSFH